jgi:hypothetical protein
VIDGETVHVRALTDAERKAAMAIKYSEESFVYVIGFGLVNDDRSPVWIMQPEETAKDFGARVLADAQMPDDTRTQLVQVIFKLTTGPTPEQLKAIEKNC